jgi:hypothetical protein
MAMNAQSHDWTGAELRGRPEAWTYRLSTREIGELEAAAAQIDVRADPNLVWAPDDFAFDAVLGAARDWRARLKSGHGFVLVSGFPIAGASETALRALYAAVGRLLGDPVSQNAAGELICDIRDTGADPHNVNTRLYTTRAEQDFHTDGADIIGLLCLKPARAGGVSRIVSSVSVYREFERRRPDLAPLLLASWPFHLHGQSGPGGPTHFMMPIVRTDSDHVSSFFIGWYIRRSQELPDAPKLTPPQWDALELYEEIANDPALYLDMSFVPGDIQWLKNAVILHKRTEYEDWPDAQRKRHLLRLWLTAHDFEDGEERLRAGVAAAPA